MALTISQVLASRPEALVSAAAQVGAASAQIDSELTRERSYLQDLAADWIGTAFDSAQASAEEMFGDQEIYRDRTQALQEEMASSGEELGRIRAELHARVTGPESHLFDIADNGTVEFGGRLKVLSVLPLLALKYGMQRLELQTAIQTALAKFAAAEKACAYQMRRISQGMVL